MKAGAFFQLSQLVSVRSRFLLALWATAPKNCALSLFLCFMPDANLFTASQYAAICDSLPDPAFILTESGRYAAILGGKDKRYYHDGSSLIGQRIAQVLAPAKAQWFLQQIHAALSSQQMLVVEYELSARDVLGLPDEGPEHAIWFEGRISALAHLYDGEKAVLWVASNITASKQLQQLLQRQAMGDELTGLHNRRSFMLAMSQAYAAFQCDGTSACLVSFDVDGFKAINDGLGHPMGDQALRDLAHAAQQVASAQDLVCRLGGDEFVILSLGRSMADTMLFAQQLLHRGRQALAPYATAGSVPTLSIGIAHFSEHDTSVEDIMRRVDQAMYISKTQGGHQVSAADSRVA